MDTSVRYVDNLVHFRFLLLLFLSMGEVEKMNKAELAVKRHRFVIDLGPIQWVPPAYLQTGKTESNFGVLLSLASSMDGRS